MTMDAHNLHLDHPAHYRICAQGRFDACWLDMLSGVWVICGYQQGGNGITILIGQVADQAALMGVLEQIYSLGFPLVLVEHLAKQEK
ncbi:hypothetical protein GC175_32990 [bacterium]|nr:hypothetical protein [bacterium]